MRACSGSGPSRRGVFSCASAAPPRATARKNRAAAWNHPSPCTATSGTTENGDEPAPRDGLAMTAAPDHGARARNPRAAAPRHKKKPVPLSPPKRVARGTGQQESLRKGIHHQHSPPWRGAPAARCGSLTACRRPGTHEGAARSEGRSRAQHSPFRRGGRGWAAHQPPPRAAGPAPRSLRAASGIPARAAGPCAPRSNPCLSLLRSTRASRLRRESGR